MNKQDMRITAAGVLLVALLAMPGCGASGDAAGDGASGSASAGEALSASEKSLAAAEEAERLRQELESAEPSAQAYEARDSAEEILSAVASQDVSSVQPYLEAAFFDPESMGLSYDEFVRGFFDGFGYRIDSIRDMQDGTVEVSAYLSTRNGYEAVQMLGKRYQEAYAAGNTSVMATYASEVWSQLAATDAGEPYTFYMSDDGESGWVVEDAAAFGAALLGGYDPRQED